MRTLKKLFGKKEQDSKEQVCYEVNQPEPEWVEQERQIAAKFTIGNTVSYLGQRFFILRINCAQNRRGWIDVGRFACENGGIVEYEIPLRFCETLLINQKTPPSV